MTDENISAPASPFQTRPLVPLLTPMTPASLTSAPVTPTREPASDLTKDMRSPKKITLKRSKIVVTFDEDFSSADLIGAQKAAGKESSRFPLYLAQRIAIFDGAKWTVGAIQEKVRGRDYIQLTSAMLSDEDEADDGDKDLAGNG